MRDAFRAIRPSRLSSALTESGLWIFNIVVVFLFTRYLFQTNIVAVFYGYDPLTILTFIGEQHRFSSVLLGLGSDPVIGLGNIAFPINPRWFLSYVLTAGPTGNIDDGPLAFAIGATELFAATVLTGRIHRIALGASVMAGWLVTLMVWPLAGLPVIISILFFFPHHAETVSAMLVTASAALWLGQGSRTNSLVLTLVIFCGMTYLLLASPSYMVIALPVVGIFGLTRLVLAATRTERLTIVTCWIAVGVACLALGYVHYLVGLLTYTAAAQFPAISRRMPSLYGGEISMLLSSPILPLSWQSIFTPERSYLGFGIIGFLAMTWLGLPPQRRFAIAMLALEGALITVGVSNFFLDYWIGPQIWYFETYILPCFGLGICFLFCTPFLLLRRVVPQWRPMIVAQAATAIGVILPLIIPALAALSIPQLAQAARLQAQRHEWQTLFSQLPQPSSDITRILKSEIKLIPGQPFRGRVAVMIGRIFPQEREWQRYSLGHYFAQIATGNLHDGPGLWQDDIPTLNESNPLITPPSFVFFRRFFIEPNDIVRRTVLGTRRIDLRMLAAVGVRFVLTDLPVTGATLRAQLRIPTSSTAQAVLGFTNIGFDSFQLFLYEIDGTNLGQVSPTKTLLASTAREILALLSDSDVSLVDTLVAADRLPERLHAAHSASFVVDWDRYRIRAASEGTSILVLPIEFSRCFKVTSHAQADTPILFRVNLFLTGIMFDRELDAELSFRSGPFGASTCRLQDLSDVRKLQIRDAFRDRPELGVLGPQ